MNTVAIPKRRYGEGSSDPATVTTEFTMTSAAPTPARVLDRNRPQPPDSDPVRGPIAIAPHVKTVPESAATVVMCL